MIYYSPEPCSIAEQEALQKIKYYQLPSGGVITAEKLDENRLRIINLCSTDPQDYLDTFYEAGNIVSMENLHSGRL